MDLSMLPDFIVEAVEHLEEMEDSLLLLEQNQVNGDILNEIFRAIHSIKGAAQYIGLERVSELSHKLETLLDLIRQGDKQLNQNTIDLFIAAKDRINLLVDELDRSQIEETEIDDLLHRIKEVLDEPRQEEKQSKDKGGNEVEDLAEVDSPARLENEALDEEYDEELLNIFMQQLKENIVFLQSQLADIESSFDKQAVLNRCRDTIKSLFSSANYMGYNMLCAHYTAWQSEIDAAEQRFSSGDETELDFMQKYLDEIMRAYPQAAADMGQKDEFVAGPDPDKLGQTLDALFNDSSEKTPSSNQEKDLIAAGEKLEEDADGLVTALSDAFDATTDSAGPVGELTRLENETIDEEYDEELLDIFMQQLKENIVFLQSQVADLKSSFDKQAVLKRCRDTIKSLFSSANYMGYNMLCAHYTAWQAEIDTAEQGFSSGDEAEIDFMQKYLDEIIRVYPQVASGMEQKDDFFAGSDQDNLDQTLDALFSDISCANEGGIGLKEKEKQAEDESEPVTPVADTVQGGYELFGKLADALEISLDEKENVPVKQMQDVIKEMISVSGEEEVPEQGTAEKVMPEIVEPSITSERDAEPNNLSAADDSKNEIAGLQEDRRKIERRLTERRKKDADGPRKVKQSMRVDADKIDHLMNQVGELVVSRAYFSQLFNEIKTLQQTLWEKTGLTKNELKPLNEFTFRLGEAGVALGRVSNELQETVMKVRMLPISQLFKRYPRLVRDLVHKFDKQVNLEVSGEETELDKMVIEEMSDPLIHIIRNAVDHGIETVSERKHLGKPEAGTLTLEAYHESNHIVIEVTDDGRGIDPERIKAKALEKGLYSEEELERMSMLELTRVIMVPGFSTAEKATETSGRGVGMDVVRKNIEKLNGTIDIESKVGQHTRMRIKIPLTLAIIQALMVRVDMETFAIPLTTVDETLRIFQQEISEIEGVEVIHLRDTTMPIFRLSNLFNIRKKSAFVEKDKYFVVVVSTGIQEVGLVVDELLGQEEVVIKPLADYLRVDSGFSGATIIGDGAISLILDIPELIEMTTDQQVLKQKNLALNRRTAGARLTGQQAQTVQ